MDFLQFVLLAYAFYLVVQAGYSTAYNAGRIEALEASLRSDGSLPQDYTPPPDKGPWIAMLEALQRSGDTSIHPERTPSVQRHTRLENPGGQSPAAQPGPATNVAQLFAAIRAKERRQAAGQWTDPQVERAVQTATEALSDRNLDEAEIARRVDAALKALEYHAAGWNNVQKK